MPRLNSFSQKGALSSVSSTLSSVSNSGIEHIGSITVNNANALLSFAIGGWRESVIVWDMPNRDLFQYNTAVSPPEQFGSTLNTFSAVTDRKRASANVNAIYLSRANSRVLYYTHGSVGADTAPTLQGQYTVGPSGAMHRIVNGNIFLYYTTTLGYWVAANGTAGAGTAFIDTNLNNIYDLDAMVWPTGGVEFSSYISDEGSNNFRIMTRIFEDGNAILHSTAFNITATEQPLVNLAVGPEDTALLYLTYPTARRTDVYEYSGSVSSGSWSNNPIDSVDIGSGIVMDQTTGGSSVWIAGNNVYSWSDGTTLEDSGETIAGLCGKDVVVSGKVDLMGNLIAAGCTEAGSIYTVEVFRHNLGNATGHYY